MTTNELRQLFLDYFQAHGHAVVPSSSLVPHNDPTLLFTNAGMVQFKDTFLGLEQRPYQRATSAQKCVRAGGKHNDLENVGYTARHHTFFEMLGNFSFGDYFKKEAIAFAWNFLTENLQLPKEKLWVTVFHDDKESEKIWLEDMKIDPQRFSRCGEKDNFWSMGDTGPCGPCTEIFYDHGPDIAGGPPGSPDEDGDRYIEIWNLVFMQYNRDAQGNLSPLPKPCVDTGMGLERIATVMQGVHNNYDIDLFQFLLKALAQITGVNDLSNTSMRVIVDHIRSSAFLIADGVIPSNEGRGYVLRRIIRRAIRHGYNLGVKVPFFYKMIAPLAEIMGQHYVELIEHQSEIEERLLHEEQLFAETLERGMQIFQQELAKVKGQEIPGDIAFKLYDTYGFPIDLTADMAREHGLDIDMPGFEMAMSQQREQSKQHSRFKADYATAIATDEATRYVGYETLKHSATVNFLVKGQQDVDCLKAGDQGIIVLNETPFYPEGGGQVGDQGEVIIAHKARFVVHDTQKQDQVILHIGEVTEGEFQLGDSVVAEVAASRQAIRLNHSATHLLHQALRQVLGPKVQQKGSLVAADRLRFDFTYNQALTADQIAAVEQLVNREIRANHSVSIKTMSLGEAQQTGALALFSEKYAEQVRVVTMGDFSCELCGGTHVQRTGDIGLFKIVNQSAVASGVRRLEAITGEVAFNWLNQQSLTLTNLLDYLKVNADQALPKLNEQTIEMNRLTKENQSLKLKLTSTQGGDIFDKAVKVEAIHVLALEVNLDRNAMRQLIDRIKNKAEPFAVLLASKEGEKVALVAGINAACQTYFTAPQMLNYVAEQLDGKGGGRPLLAEGGGSNVTLLAPALASLNEWIKTQQS